MERREFMRLLGTGALAAMLVPTVAKAFESGTLSEDELFDLVKKGGEGVFIQKGVVVTNLIGPSRHESQSVIWKHPYSAWDRRGNPMAWYERQLHKRGHVPVPNGAGETVTMEYVITGKSLGERKDESCV